jgi:hypothetical protein
MAASLELRAVHEWLAHDPFGRPKPSDVSEYPPAVTNVKGEVELRAGRNGYVSFRVLVSGEGEFKLSGSLAGGLEVDLFKAWYHRQQAGEGEEAAYWPDALIPVSGRQVHRLPDPDNRIKGQTTQEFWVDVFVPPDEKPGRRSGRIRLAANGEETALPVRVQVIERTIPEEPCVIIDHNSYGCRFLHKFFPKTFARNKREDRLWNASIDLLHDYHRLVHEHRGLLSNLGYGHSGALDPIYAPPTEGRGREKRLADWTLYDRHYGPLFDGSAFATAAPGCPGPRRPAKPIWGVYAPFNPEYPASYLYWGEKGYEVEFTRCVGQFDAHLQEKGWTKSRLAFYLNHKKRYRWFGWDGDEVKDIKDMVYQREMLRMWEPAIEGSPVPWLYRMDASWQMKNLFPMMAGHPNFWVLGGFHRWYPEEIPKLVERGDTVWWYNGTPAMTAASSGILSLSYETWMRRMHGNCAWLSTNPGPDPWFDSNGGNTGIVYPGERFGIKGPIPGIRMKIERNGIQDIDLVNAACEAAGTKDAVQAEFKERIPIPLWKKPPRAAVELPPEEWDSRKLREEHEPEAAEQKQLDPCWWQTVRKQALAEEGT